MQIDLWIIWLPAKSGRELQYIYGLLGIPLLTKISIAMHCNWEKSIPVAVLANLSISIMDHARVTNAALFLQFSLHVFSTTWHSLCHDTVKHDTSISHCSGNHIGGVLDTVCLWHQRRPLTLHCAPQVWRHKGTSSSEYIAINLDFYQFLGNHVISGLMTSSHMKSLLMGIGRLYWAHSLCSWEFTCTFILVHSDDQNSAPCISGQKVFLEYSDMLES